MGQPRAAWATVGHIDARPPSIDPGARGRLTARFGDAVLPWLDELPAVLGALAARWRLELVEPIPRGSVAVVFHARGPDARRSVLKISPDRPRLALEASALTDWNAAHCPEVLAFDTRLGAMLLEAIEPGEPLASAAAHPGTEEVAALIRGLHSCAVRAPFPAVADRVAALFDSSARLYELHPGVSRTVRRTLYERGRDMASRLARDHVPTVLLHGDLTPSNILAGGPDRGLVAIDPAPCVGDAAFDAVDLILWRADDPATVTARADALAAATDGDAERMIAWCGAFAAMSALELATSRERTPGGRLEMLLDLASSA